jgi:YfiH family protein
MESFFTNRHGGFSHGDYSSWNLASHVGDDPADVELNRTKLREQVGDFAVMSQVHGDTVVVLDQLPTEVPVADAIITGNPDLALVVMVADCIPLLLRSEKLMAAVHVGRAGLMNSIALKTVAQMRELGATQISGSIGPAICGSCYEVPQELHDQVSASHPLASSKTRTGTPALDLPRALIAALAVVDVPVANSASCTLEDDNYFSYRRNQVTGRQAGVIKL